MLRSVHTDHYQQLSKNTSIVQFNVCPENHPQYISTRFPDVVADLPGCCPQTYVQYPSHLTPHSAKAYNPTGTALRWFPTVVCCSCMQLETPPPCGGCLAGQRCSATPGCIMQSPGSAICTPSRHRPRPLPIFLLPRINLTNPPMTLSNSKPKHRSSLSTELAGKPRDRAAN